MELVKQYIVQCIISAANNLRLSTEKIEVVALLREQIVNADSLEKEIRDMKKITELSTFAIRLNEVYNFITTGKIDFLKLSEKFKEHSHYLVRDLNSLLEKMNPQSFRQAINNLKLEQAIPIEKEIEIKAEEQKQPEAIHDYDIKLKQADISDLSDTSKNESEKLKEEFIFEVEDKNEEILFEKYEEKILNPIKELDSFLKTLSLTNLNESELDKYCVIMKKNAELSSKIGFEIISNMHHIFSHGLASIKNKTLAPTKDIIEGLRACLIVIVAVVRGKEVDITNYLNKAEKFGYKIKNLM